MFGLPILGNCLYLAGRSSFERSTSILPYLRDAKIFSIVPRHLVYRSSSMTARQSLAHKLLLRNPASRVRSPGAILPRPGDDPHPVLTNALHALWDAVYPSLCFVQNVLPSFTRQGGHASIAEAFENGFGNALVSRLFVLISYF